MKKRTYVLVQMHLCFSSNALAFGLECACVLIQTALRFGLNELAFLKIGYYMDTEFFRRYFCYIMIQQNPV